MGGFWVVLSLFSAVLGRCRIGTTGVLFGNGSFWRTSASMMLCADNFAKCQPGCTMRYVWQMGHLLETAVVTLIVVSSFWALMVLMEI